MQLHKLSFRQYSRHWEVALVPVRARNGKWLFVFRAIRDGATAGENEEIEVPAGHYVIDEGLDSDIDPPSVSYCRRRELYTDLDALTAQAILHHLLNGEQSDAAT